MSDIRAVKVRDDKTRGRGYVILSLEGTGLQVPDGIVLTRKGSGKTEYLDSRGWQPAQAKIKPDHVEPTQSGMEIFLGPTVVQHVRPNSNYTVGLVSADGKVESRGLTWKAMPFVGTPGKEWQPQQKPKRPDGYTSPDGRVDPGRVQNGGKEEPVKDNFAQEDGRKPPPVVAGNKNPDTVLTPKRVIAGTALVLAAIALGAFLYLKGIPDSGQGVSDAEEVVSQPDPDQESPEGVPHSPDILSPEEEVRRFIATGPSAERITEKGHEMLQRGHAGLALTLYRRAGDAGDSAALMAAARLYDPLEPTGGPEAPQKRSEFAFNFYRRAREMGNPDANGAISRLRGWLETEAAAGDRDARQLLHLISLEN